MATNIHYITFGVCICCILLGVGAYQLLDDHKEAPLDLESSVNELNNSGGVIYYLEGGVEKAHIVQHVVELTADRLIEYDLVSIGGEILKNKVYSVPLENIVDIVIDH